MRHCDCWPPVRRNGCHGCADSYHWGLKHGEVRMTPQNWTTDELRAELLRFERELRAANLKDSSIQTYVDRSGRFLKWLDGDYHPRGPN
jgi:hypothetical protein